MQFISAKKNEFYTYVKLQAQASVINLAHPVDQSGGRSVSAV